MTDQDATPEDFSDAVSLYEQLGGMGRLVMLAASRG